MTKSELVEQMAKDAGISKSAANAALNSLMDGITKALKKKDGKVTLVGVHLLNRMEIELKSKCDFSVSILKYSFPIYIITSHSKVLYFWSITNFLCSLKRWCSLEASILSLSFLEFQYSIKK